MAELQELVGQRLQGEEKVEADIERIVCELYGLTAAEMEQLAL